MSECKPKRGDSSECVEKTLPLPSQFKRWGYVYIIRCEGYEAFKVGMTRSSPQSRVSALQTGCPFKLNLLLAYPVMDAERVEASVHALLAGCRLEGEWFQVANPWEAEQVLALLRCEADYYAGLWSVYFHECNCDVSSLPKRESTLFDPADHHDALGNIAWDESITGGGVATIAAAVAAGILQRVGDELRYGAMTMPTVIEDDLLFEISCKTRRKEGMDRLNKYAHV